MEVLLVSPDPASRDMMRLVVRSIERRLGSPIVFFEAANGEEGVRIARRAQPDAIVADEIASREGAFSLARTLHDDVHPFRGAIVILLERRQDEWLADWSGADAWFVKPIDPFALADRLLELVAKSTETKSTEPKSTEPKSTEPKSTQRETA
jgi:CheY-like chemotaxis protein